MAFLAGIGAGLADLAGNFGLNAQSYNQQSNLQSQYFQGQSNLLNQQHDLATSDFTKYGLPSFMAAGAGPRNQTPSTYFQLGGTNFARGGTFGSNQPVQTNMWQQLMHWGTPGRNNESETETPGRSYTPGTSSNTFPNEFKSPGLGIPVSAANDRSYALWSPIFGPLQRDGPNGTILQGSYINPLKEMNNRFDPDATDNRTFQPGGVPSFFQQQAQTGPQYVPETDFSKFSFHDPFSPWGFGRNGT